MKSSAIILKKLHAKEIIIRYKETLNIDVERFFKGIEFVNLVEDTVTKHRFFEPRSIAGDSSFYEDLDKFEWYYMPWKWEHQIVLDQLKKSDKILEVGSGGLGFIEKLNSLNYNITGLELNKNSIKIAEAKQLNVCLNTVEQFSHSHQNTFDMVCSFQVLEHISDVIPFLKAQVECLKSDGKLIICVPNNDSFIRYTDGGVLNLPPHHMSRWNPLSLKKIENFLPIKFEKFHYEPLQDYHKQWYIKSISDHYLSKYKLLRGLNKLFSLNSLLRIYVNFNCNNIKGHSIMATFIKK